LHVGASGAVVIGSVTHPPGLIVDGAATLAQALTVASVAVTGRLDVTDLALVVAYPASEASPIDAGTDLVRSGRNGGSWDGPGIVTSLASGNLTSLGITDQPGQVVVRYTYAGDATLDGRIDVDDYGRIDFNVGAAADATWSQGDFNYDGKVNVDDY